MEGYEFISEQNYCNEFSIPLMQKSKSGIPGQVVSTSR